MAVEVYTLYDRIKELYNEDQHWWLYNALKFDLEKNERFRPYIPSTQVPILGHTPRFTSELPHVKRVIFHNPATIIFWTDGTKTVVKCQEVDEYDCEKGFVMAYLKKLLGNDNTFNKEINKWVWGE